MLCRPQVAIAGRKALFSSSKTSANGCIKKQARRASPQCLRSGIIALPIQTNSQGILVGLQGEVLSLAFAKCLIEQL